MDFSKYQKEKQNIFTTNHKIYMILVLTKSYICIMLIIYIFFMLQCHVHIKAKSSGLSIDEVLLINVLIINVTQKLKLNKLTLMKRKLRQLMHGINFV